MTRVPNPDEQTAQPTASATPHVPRVLLIGGERQRRTLVRAALEDAGAVVNAPRSTSDAIKQVGRQLHDAAVVLGGEELIAQVRAADINLSVIACIDAPTVAEAVAILRCGACDLIRDDASIAELISRLEAARDRTRFYRARDSRAERLQSLCRKLNNAREDVTRHVGALCDDLTEAYQDLSQQIGRVGIAGEFGSLARQQLDVEELLRTTLEYTLAKAGPMNAGIFLPSSTGEFTLGAYVNYDCPKDAAEMVLDQLADVVPSHFEHRAGLHVINSAGAVEASFGDDAHWFEGRSVAIHSCHEGDECLAVVCLFRDATRPFEDEHIETLQVIGEIFTAQLGRVIHVHHRHLPPEEWGEQGYGDIDLAA